MEVPIQRERVITALYTATEMQAHTLALLQSKLRVLPVVTYLYISPATNDTFPFLESFPLYN